MTGSPAPALWSGAGTQDYTALSQLSEPETS